jgi:riboflavin synthase
MFTGIIQDIGRLLRIIPQGNGARLVIETRLPLEEVRLGDSIAVCGVCLTVVRKEAGIFEADISRETVARSTLRDARPGERLHLERAMRLSDRLDGHLVMGHVDAVGKVSRRSEQGDSLYLECTAPPEVHRYLVEKGSVAVHGVSLTVNALTTDGFAITLVPYTRALTMLEALKVGDQVNLEADIMGKYVERLLAGRGARSGSGGLDLETLSRNGFLR